MADDNVFRRVKYILTGVVDTGIKFAFLLICIIIIIIF